MRRSVVVVVAFMGLTACKRNTHTPLAPDDANVTSATDGAIADAAMTTDAASPPDAGISIDAGAGNVVSCYTEAASSTTCTLPTHCCFSNFSAQHDGSCTTSVCGWGTISCDGPEDCGTGQRCCAHALIDPDQGLYGYTVACQTGPCGAAPVNQELCHSSGTCPSGAQCASAFANDNDLPRTLSICK